MARLCFFKVVPRMLYDEIAYLKQKHPKLKTTDTTELLKYACSNVDAEHLKYSPPMFNILRPLKRKCKYTRMYTYQDIRVIKEV